MPNCHKCDEEATHAHRLTNEPNPDYVPVCESHASGDDEDI